MMSWLCPACIAKQASKYSEQSHTICPASAAALCQTRCYSHFAGLVEDQEVESMNGLVEQKLKKLHYFPPQFHIHSPDTMLAAHPLLASIPDKKFSREVRL